MKMREDHYAALRAAINLYAEKYPVPLAETHTLYRETGLSDARYAWDLLAASGADTTPLYAYLDDRHIQTALLRIVRDLER